MSSAVIISAGVGFVSGLAFGLAYFHAILRMTRAMTEGVRSHVWLSTALRLGASLLVFGALAWIGAAAALAGLGGFEVARFLALARAREPS